MIAQHDRTTHNYFIFRFFSDALLFRYSFSSTSSFSRLSPFSPISVFVLLVSLLFMSPPFLLIHAQTIAPTRFPTATPTRAPSTNPTVAVITSGVIVSLIGNGTCGFKDATDTSSMVFNPYDVWVDASGRALIADRGNHRVRIMSTVGIVSTIAGTGFAGFTCDHVAATSCALNLPGSVAADTNFNVYVSDTANHRIRKITSSGGIITTIGGTGIAGLNGNNGPATNAQISSPCGLYVTSYAMLYFADLDNHMIRAINLNTGIISVLAGTGNPGSGGDGGSATLADLHDPTDLWVNTAGRVFITDMNNNKVRAVDFLTGMITTYAGTGAQSPVTDGVNATQSALFNPVSITGDAYNNVYVYTLSTFTIRRIDGITGKSYLYAGSGVSGYSGDTILATQAKFSGVYGMMAVPSLIIADSANCRIRKVFSSVDPTLSPTRAPTSPTQSPTFRPSNPTYCPSSLPSSQPSGQPSSQPSSLPSSFPTNSGTRKPSLRPTRSPTRSPTCLPSFNPTVAVIGRGVIVSIAGNGSCGFNGNTLTPATSALVNLPYDIWADPLSGGIYLCDRANHRIRLITVSNMIGTTAGTGIAGYNGDGILATASLLNYPRSVTTDTNGVIYVSDAGNHRIRAISLTNIISTIIGIGTPGSTGNNGPANSALINNPGGLMVSSTGILYFADMNNYVIRAVNINTGIITLFAGTGSKGSGGDGSSALTAEFSSPTDLWLNTIGNVFITDMNNHKVRMVNVVTGIITTFAGTGSPDNTVEGVNATQTAMMFPTAITGDKYNNVYVFSLGSYSVLRVDGVSSKVYKYAGNGYSGYTGDTITATSASFQAVYGMSVIASDSSLVVADSSNCRVRKVISAVTPTTLPSFAPTSPTVTPTTRPTNPTSQPSSQPSTLPSSSPSALPTVHTALPTSWPTWPANPNITSFPTNLPSSRPSPHPTPVPTQVPTILIGKGAVITLIGNGSCGFSGDGQNKDSASLNNPYDAWVDSRGQIYVTDRLNNRVRLVSTESIITTIAGTNSSGYNGEGLLATISMLYQPRSAACDTQGNLFISDTMNQRIRRVSVSTGCMTTIAGTGTRGRTGNNGPATSALLNYPSGLFVTSSGMLYFADTNNQMIRAIDLSSGLIKVIAGTGSFGRSGDGRAASFAKLATPSDVWINTKGDLFIADTNNYRVRLVSAVTGIISTYAGTGSMIGEEVNGVNATQSIVLFPVSLIGDTLSNLYIFETGSYTIRRVDYLSKIITAYAGSGGFAGYNGDQISATSAMFTEANGLGIDLNSDVIVPDARNCRVRRVYTVSDPTSVPSSQPSSQPTVQPSRQPSSQPTARPSRQPSSQPSSRPTAQPSKKPSSQPSSSPTSQPSKKPTTQPSSHPTSQPTTKPSSQPTKRPSSLPTSQPTSQPTNKPSTQPTSSPTRHPTSQPTAQPSSQPIARPTAQPSNRPSSQPTVKPSAQPTARPSTQPSSNPSSQPTSQPSASPSAQPVVNPTAQPTRQPTSHPTKLSEVPTVIPSTRPPSWTDDPTATPTLTPSIDPTATPTPLPTTATPSVTPTQSPSSSPSSPPTSLPSKTPSATPTDSPSSQPSSTPSSQPTSTPSERPTSQPSSQPSAIPSSEPSSYPTSQPSSMPSQQPTNKPSSFPSSQPSSVPTGAPTNAPTSQPSSHPSSSPSTSPSSQPSAGPSSQPSSRPSSLPTTQPTKKTATPTFTPSQSPTLRPSHAPTKPPTKSPTRSPSSVRSISPTFNFLTNGSLPSSKPVSIFPYSEKFRQTLFLFGDLSSAVNPYDNIQLSDPVIGASYLILGQRTNRALPTSIDLTESPDSPDMTRYYPLSPNAAMSQDTSVRSISVLKDVNGDGFNDLIIGDPLNAMAYVLFGKKIGLVGLVTGFTVYGETVNDYLGWSVSSLGDVNNDGFNDFITCALVASRCYVIYGKASGWSDVYLGGNFGTQKGFMITSSYIVPGGMAVSDAGDFNGDGIDDIAVSVSGSSSVINFVFIIFGKATTFSKNLELSQLINGVDGVRIITPIWSFAGLSLSGGFDYNHDGFDDIIIGSVPFNRGYLTQRSYVIYGKPSNQLTKDIIISTMTEQQGFTIIGAGLIVNGEVGDLNGDGFDDIVVMSYMKWPGQNGAYLFVYPDKVSSSPSLYPSSSPSIASESPTIASASPTTDSPSFAPSNPTALPTESPSGPTLLPTHQPTTPTVSPTKTPSTPPTRSPTIRPTRSPTTRPTLTAPPSLSPSIILTSRPTRSPSKRPTRSPTALNLNPTSQPSSQPTISTALNFSTVLISTGGNYSLQTVARKTQYIIEAETDTTITSHSLISKYTVKPFPDVTTTITNFHAKTDFIDLTAFPTITNFDELSYESDPLNFLLPNNQKIILSSLTVKGEVSEKNFIFAAAVTPISDDGGNSDASSASFWNKELLTAIGALVGMAIISVTFYRYIDAKRTPLAGASEIRRRRFLSSDDEEKQRLLAPHSSSTVVPIAIMAMSEEDEEREALLAPLLSKEELEEVARGGGGGGIITMEREEGRKSVKTRRYTPPPSEISSRLLYLSSSSSSGSIEKKKKGNEKTEPEKSIVAPKRVTSPSERPRKTIREDFGGTTPKTPKSMEESISSIDMSSEKYSAIDESPSLPFKEKENQFNHNEKDDEEEEDDEKDDNLSRYGSHDTLYSMFRSRTQSEEQPRLPSSSSSSSRGKSEKSDSDYEEDSRDEAGEKEKEVEESISDMSAFSTMDDEEFFLLRVDDDK